MRNEQQKILCPRCDYRPRLDDRWACVPSCATVWHTFWTAGVCPGCALRWPLTQCPSCGVVSPHRQWYREPDRARGDEHAHDDEQERADLLATR